MRLGVADKRRDVVVGEKRIGEDFRWWEPLDKGSRVIPCQPGCFKFNRGTWFTYGRLSMPWQDMVICSRCAERSDMITAVVVLGLQLYFRLLW